MTSLALLPLLLRAPQADAVNDVVLPLALEATIEAAGDGGWTAIAVDGREGGAGWRRARATFELPEEFEAGDWMVCVGGPPLRASARVNGHALEPIPDAFARDPRLCAGPRFPVASHQLRVGTNSLQLSFEGQDGGRGLERGPSVLLSRTPAARLKLLSAAGDLTVATANFAGIATSSRGHHLLERVAFKLADAGDEPRLAAQVDLALLDPSGKEIPMRELGKRRLLGAFPTLSLEMEDPRLPDFRGQVKLSAPVLTSPLRLCDARLVSFTLSQFQPKEYKAAWRIRFFPAQGGPLRVVRGEGFVLLRNERVGLFAEDGRVLGSEESPSGLAVVLSQAGASGTTFRAAEMVSRRCGVVSFENDPLDPSQAESMEDLVESVLDLEEEILDAGQLLASTLANEPVQGNVAAGLATRASAVAALLGMRRRGSRFVYAPPAGAHSAEAYWADTFSLIHFPQHERNAVEWLLSTQREDGAVRGELPAEASDAELAAADAYAVLRACRWFRWVYDGDRFLKLAPHLARALEHADSVGALAAPADTPARERLSSAHVALARATAHRELAAALEQLAALPEVAAASAKAAAAQLEQLLGPPGDGGSAEEGGLARRPGEDPREDAVALALDLLEEERAAALAKALARIEPPGDRLDWRDALVARALLQSGRVSALGRRFERLEREAREEAVPASSACASYHGALSFGLLGIRREDFGTIEIRPRLVERQHLRTAIRVPEGALRVQILGPGRQLERQAIVENETTLDLMAVIGLPDGIGQGRPARKGELVHRLYEEVVAQGESWRGILR